MVQNRLENACKELARGLRCRAVLTVASGRNGIINAISVKNPSISHVHVYSATGSPGRSFPDLLQLEVQIRSRLIERMDHLSQ